MSINPVVLNGMTQRTQDISNLKQQEDDRPIVEQHNLSVQQEKKEERILHQVADTKKKENEGYRYDAREKGNNQYYGSGSSKKKKEKKEKKEDLNKDGKVIFKGQNQKFDIKI